ncbi:oligosaccharide repeat unit polymerase [Alkaliphilus sp. MSJ-5]|uniref:Oligosaccharide repeat unit polymerase n=1 Tax=Alkaliphilus flagellatus TaxID=2841507 RepID=A0ABS6G2Z9_9FIRM|nr:O-antigen polymerase [Alkaliphilus flagellatus]MBU5676534.1 oligosaccharide repeat unit polymerase [Alkaliphilus flagellatus]
MSVLRITNAKRMKSMPFLGIVTYRILLDVIYKKIVVPFFGYSGFEMEHSIALYILSWTILFLLMPVIIKNNNDQNHPSSLIILILSLVVFVPFTTMMGYGFFSGYYIICNTIYWLFLFLFHRLFLHIKFISLRPPKNTFSNFVIMIIGIVFLFVNIFISWKYTGFRFTFDLFSVYTLRSETSTFNLPLAIEYIFSASKAINPLLLVYSFTKKKYGISSLILLVQFLSFGINGMKSVFFITLLVMLVFLFYKDSYINKIPWLCSGLCLVGLLEFVISKSFVIVDLLIRRMMFLTNMLNAYYFDFFTNNTPDYFRQSILRYFGIKSPYSDIRYMIGDIYFSRPEMGANSGLISDAISNLGIIGVVIMPIMIAIALKLFDNCIKGLNKRLYIALCVLVAYYFISSFLFTILLTHGFLALCIVFYLLPRDSETM